MHHGAATGERHEEPAHEIDRVIGGDDAQVARARPEWEDGYYSGALLEIVFVREDAAFGLPARAGGIDDAGGIFSSARDEGGCAFTCRAEIFPALRSREIGVGRRFRDEDCARGEIAETFRLRDAAPQMISDDEELGLRGRDRKGAGKG